MTWFFWLNPTHLVEKERIYNYFRNEPLLTEVCPFNFFEILFHLSSQALLIWKISFCIFFILSVYLENTQKVLKRPWRMRWKYLSVYGDYGDTGNTQKVFKRIRRIRGKNLCIHGKAAKRLLACSRNNTQKDTKLSQYLG